ncbi:CLUMA_CG008017, isoform A [Clunio marinus]|uniref:CLUMA_CG008017, isoform A n=1 Tax=Clunio marinus TaxID=568069 RepID=A0A1J1I2I2_9DIPT|nr:CLUMA_CG008017, isoform A [Clunio marinus]
MSQLPSPKMRLSIEIKWNDKKKKDTKTCIHSMWNYIAMLLSEAVGSSMLNALIQWITTYE